MQDSGTCEFCGSNLISGSTIHLALLMCIEPLSFTLYQSSLLAVSGLKVSKYIQTKGIKPDDVFIFFVPSFGITPTPVHDRSIDICRTECVGLVQEGDHREQNCPVKRTNKILINQVRLLNPNNISRSSQYWLVLCDLNPPHALFQLVS